jgi:GT2 family glycosyltransferase
MKIAAVVVTYNRLNLLKECINAIRNQTHKVDEIIVINNSSTDGTLEWLEEQKDLTVITQENLGGAGGFYTGIKTAYEKGYDWIWCMDDDVYADSNCLKELLEISKITNNKFKILQPSRKFYNNNSHWKYGTKFNFIYPNFNECVNPISLEGSEKLYTKILSFPFEGPLINRSVIESIGNVNKELFMGYDDTDFSYRAYKANIEVALVKKALLIKKLLPVYDARLFNKKDYYFFKNSIIFDKRYGNPWIVYTRSFWRLVRYHKNVFKLFVKLLSKKESFNVFLKSYSLLMKAFYDGITSKVNK